MHVQFSFDMARCQYFDPETLANHLLVKLRNYFWGFGIPLFLGRLVDYNLFLTGHGISVYSERKRTEGNVMNHLVKVRPRTTTCSAQEKKDVAYSRLLKARKNYIPSTYLLDKVLQIGRAHV